MVPTLQRPNNFAACLREACRSMAKKYGVNVRDFDRANWRWSKRKSKPSTGATLCGT